MSTGMANKAHTLDGGIPLQPNPARRCPAASDVRRWAACFI